VKHAVKHADEWNDLWNDYPQSFQWNVPPFQSGTIWNDFAQAVDVVCGKVERFWGLSGTGHTPFRSPRFYNGGGWNAWNDGGKIGL
jgi:hypothetical protein